MDIIVKSGTDRHVIKVIQYLVDHTIDQSIHWIKTYTLFDQHKEIEINNYSCFIPINSTEFDISLLIKKSATPVDTMKDIDVTLEIENFNNEDHDKLVYKTKFYSTDKYTALSCDCLLQTLVECINYLRFDKTRENNIRKLIDDVIK